MIAESQDVIARSRAAREEARLQRAAARAVVEQVRAMIARSRPDSEAGAWPARDPAMLDPAMSDPAKGGAARVSGSGGAG
ncbi:hypothetical protein FV223_21090 [Methylobacterium sp. WL116]|nr:hypothetical protein FV223_21090 [Methylobacterium sp. WL116]